MAYYSSYEYWESRYGRDTTVFEWLQTYSDIRGYLRRYASATDKILIAGCGTSELGEHMIGDGFRDITNVDYVPAAVAAMEARKRRLAPMLQSTGSHLAYAVADLAALDRIAANTFNVVIDKGTLDGALCGSEEGAQYAYVVRILREISRVLKGGGGKLLILSHAPKESRRLLEGQEFGWKIDVHTVPRPDACMDSDAVPLLTEDIQRSHYFYVCTKR